jgi:hypothetical protein
MAKKKKTQASYTVILGCETADGVRYEIGDAYDAEKHSLETTTALLEMEALEETNGDS